MGLNFPNAPSAGQKFGNYSWDGEKWAATPGTSNVLASLAVGGRLTLQAGVPAPRTDQVGKTQLFFSPDRFDTAPLFKNGTGWITRQFTSGPTDITGLTLNLGGSANFPRNTLHDFFLVDIGGVLTVGARAWDAGMLWTESLIPGLGTIATPPGTPGRIVIGTGANIWNNSSQCFDGITSSSLAGANFGIVNPSNLPDAAGQPQNAMGQFWGTGAQKLLSSVKLFAPTDNAMRGDQSPQLTIVTDASNDGANWHFMSTWRGDDSVNGGTVFTIPVSVTEQARWDYHRVSIDGNNTHAIRLVELQFFERIAPAGGRRIVRIDGVPVNDAAMTVRTTPGTTANIAQYEGLFLGTGHMTTAADGAMTVHADFGPARALDLWNMHNRRRKTLVAGTYNTQRFYVPVTTQRWNVIESATQGDNFSLSYVQGLDDEWVTADLLRSVYLDCQAAVASYECGIGVDTRLTFSGTEGSCNQDKTGQVIGWLPHASCDVPPTAGLRTLYGIERQGNNGAGVQNAFTGPRSSKLTATLMC